MNIAQRNALKHRLGQLAGAAIVAALAFVLAAMYMGHSKSPYGVCYAPSGRDVPCELLAHR